MLRSFYKSIAELPTVTLMACEGSAPIDIEHPVAVGRALAVVLFYAH